MDANTMNCIIKWAQVFAPLITALGILAALFQRQLLSLIWKPKLKIDISTNPFLFHETIAVNQHDPNRRDTQYWQGLSVKNVGNKSATKLQVYLSGIYSNVFKDIECYKRLQLRKSWDQGNIEESLAPGVPTRWDICFISKTTPDKMDFSFYNTPNMFNNIEFLKDEESYFEFEAIAIAENARIVRKRFRISFYANYNINYNVKDL